MKESGSVIETVGLSKRYGSPPGSLLAVDRLGLQVRRGELFAFLGPNGAGKTTTIRMLTGLIRPTEGKALVDGLDVRRDPIAVKARVGVVPQQSNLYAELTARDNLVFVGQLYGLPRRAWGSRADELLAQFGLADRARARFSSLSGGMKRRLVIAAALVHKPSILFLDEPTTGLDVQSARSVRALIGSLRQQGVTVFLTTHQIAEAEQLADRVAIIVGGKLVAVDTPGALRTRVQDESMLEVAIPGANEGLLAALRDSPAIGAVSRRGDVVRLTVSSVDGAVRDLSAVSERFGAHITAIRTMAPSLEDAFVQLTQLDVEAMQGGGGRRSGGGAR